MASAHWQEAELDFAEVLKQESHLDEAMRYSFGLERGWLRFCQEKYAEALADLEKARTEKPDLVPAYTLLALVYEKQAKRKLAIAQLDRAVALSANQAVYRASQAGLYRSRADLHRRELEWDLALPDIEQAIRLEMPTNTYQLAVDHVERAQLLRLLNRCEEAVNACDDALRLGAGYSQAHYERGLAFFEMADREPAVDLRREKYEKALDSFAEYARLEKPDADFYRARGRLRSRLVPLMSQALTAARAGGPKEVAKVRELVDRIQKLQTDAVADYGRAIDLKPDAATHAQRGWDLLLLLDAPKLALPDFKRAIELRNEAGDPEKASDFMGSGLCRVQVGQWRQGVTDAEQGLELGRNKEKDREWAFLLFNAARVFAQAAGRISSETAGRPLDPALTKARFDCEKRAVDLLGQAMLSLSEPERRPFWQQATSGDRALQPIRLLPGYKELNDLYGQPRDANQPH
jgi:tetratricopeptide (TPR) repeat protein